MYYVVYTYTRYAHTYEGQFESIFFLLLCLLTDWLWSIHNGHAAWKGEERPSERTNERVSWLFFSFFLVLCHDFLLGCLTTQCSKWKRGGLKHVLSHYSEHSSTQPDFKMRTAGWVSSLRIGPMMNGLSVKKSCRKDLWKRKKTERRAAAKTGARTHRECVAVIGRAY